MSEDPDDGGLRGPGGQPVEAAREWGDPITEPIEPGRPDPENVAFVLLGALAALYVFARVAGLV